MEREIEIRVRPVIRHLVTIWIKGFGSRLIGEFENPEVADEVATALQKGTPGSLAVTSSGGQLSSEGSLYLIVPEANFTPESIVYYAASLEDAAKVCESAAQRHGMSFKAYLGSKI